MAHLMFTPGDVLLPCPVCDWVHDELTEGELWRHFASRDDAATRIARAYGELDAIRRPREDGEGSRRAA